MNTPLILAVALAWWALPFAGYVIGWRWGWPWLRVASAWALQLSLAIVVLSGLAGGPIAALMVAMVPPLPIPEGWYLLTATAPFYAATAVLGALVAPALLAAMVRRSPRGIELLLPVLAVATLTTLAAWEARTWVVMDRRAAPLGAEIVWRQSLSASIAAAWRLERPSHATACAGTAFYLWSYRLDDFVPVPDEQVHPWDGCPAADRALTPS